MKKLMLRNQCTNQMCGSTQLGTTKAIIVKPDFVSCDRLTPNFHFFQWISYPFRYAGQEQGSILLASLFVNC